jgi:hypothetical protein
MRKLSTFLIVLMSGCALAADPPAHNSLTPAEKEQGWTLLFDGQSLNGWADPRKQNPPGDAWTIEDGCIKALTRPRLTEDLFTTRTFGDFEFAFEWRISSGGNSGVKYRIQEHLWLVPIKPGERFESQVERSFLDPVTSRPEKGQDYVIGFEYQITDDTANRDAQSNAKHTAGSLYDMVGPSASPAKPAGEFNQSRIVVRGKHIEHWLNGVKVVDSSLESPDALAGIRKRWAVAPHVLDLLTKQPKTQCPISLQNHGDDTWFRNLKIRPL